VSSSDQRYLRCNNKRKEIFYICASVFIFLLNFTVRFYNFFGFILLLSVLQASIYTADEPDKNTEIDEAKEDEQFQQTGHKRQAHRKKNSFFLFLLFFVN
jgi:hypothetical protein